MPLKPNFIERFLISRGKIPGPLIDFALPSFIITALTGASHIDLFQVLDESEASVDELSEKIGANKRPLQNLLRALKQIGYVEKKNGRWTLTSYTRKAVPVEEFSEILPFFREQLVRTVQKVDQALMETPEEGVIGWEPLKGGEFGRSYQSAMRWLARQSVEEVTKKVELPEGVTRMIDVGGSHGLYCVEICRKYPELQGTVMDWPIGIEAAEETLEQESDVAGRIETLEGNFFEDELPGGYDYAFLGNIIHSNSPDQNRYLLMKLADATTEQGSVGILDQFDNVSGSGFNQSVAALIGWNLFLFVNGRSYAVEEVEEWLKETGFGNVEVKPLKKSPGFTLLTASK
ncbi:MAG: methyltransferase [Balneolaceae bacterium]|nr:methyltransferase [Balneolaceae bacterium]